MGASSSIAVQKGTAFKMLATGSLYIEFLHLYPAGLEMDFELLPDADGLDDEMQTEAVFKAKKVDEDHWFGVPNTIGKVTTRILFEHVRSVLLEDGEESLTVSRLASRGVKQEVVEHGQEPPPMKFSTFHGVVDLDAEEFPVPIGGPTLSEKGFRGLYEKARRRQSIPECQRHS